MLDPEAAAANRGDRTDAWGIASDLCTGGAVPGEPHLADREVGRKRNVDTDFGGICEQPVIRQRESADGIWPPRRGNNYKAAGSFSGPGDPRGASRRPDL